MSNRAKKSIQWSRAELALRALVFVIVIAIAAAAAWYSIADQSGSPVFAFGSDVRVPLRKLKRGKTLLFTYALDDVTTTQVAMQRGEDDVLRAAFAACRSCRRYRHYLSFGKLICGHCNHSIVLPKPSDFPDPKAGCTPIALPYAIEKDELVVSGKAIAEIFDHWYRPRTIRKENRSGEGTSTKFGPSNQKAESGSPSTR